MELSLVVLTPGKRKGMVIPIPHSPFLIGRDPECHLRPTSRQISKRQCALILRDHQAFVEDFETRNGTFLNDRQIKGVVELLNGDCLRLGPLVFSVCLDAQASTTRVEASAAPRTPEDEAAALLLAMEKEEGRDWRGSRAAREKASDSTVQENQVTPRPESRSRSASGRRRSGDVGFGSVSSAREILKRYKRQAGQ